MYDSSLAVILQHQARMQ